MTKDNQKEPVYNLDEIKKQAKQSINQGSVTADYPLDIEEACRLLNEALATEIMCVLRYRHHQIIAKGINKPQVLLDILRILWLYCHHNKYLTTKYYPQHFRLIFQPQIYP